MPTKVENQNQWNKKANTLRLLYAHQYGTTNLLRLFGYNSTTLSRVKTLQQSTPLLNFQILLVFMNVKIFLLLMLRSGIYFFLIFHSSPASTSVYTLTDVWPGHIPSPQPNKRPTDVTDYYIAYYPNTQNST